jgi:hypothetical protein
MHFTYGANHQTKAAKANNIKAAWLEGGDKGPRWVSTCGYRFDLVLSGEMTKHHTKKRIPPR